MSLGTLIRPMVAKKAKAEGKAEGKLEGVLKVAKKMLMKGLGIKEVAEITELPVSEIKHLKGTY